MYSGIVIVFTVFLQRKINFKSGFPISIRRLPAFRVAGSSGRFIRHSCGGLTLAIKGLWQFEEDFDIIAESKGLVA
jgi:hypothetical protein